MAKGNPPPERGKRISGRGKRFFRRQPSEVCKRQRMMFLAIKTEDSVIKGKISFYCRMLKVMRQGFYKYLANIDRPWKYQQLADAMRTVVSEDECNGTYGRIRMYQALLLKQPEGVRIPSERTVYRILEEIGLSHRPKHRPNGITRADREAHKSVDLLKRDFKSREPLKKCITDITEIKASVRLPMRSGLSRRFGEPSSILTVEPGTPVRPTAGQQQSMAFSRA